MATGEVCKPNVATVHVHRVAAQALIDTARGARRAASLSARKGRLIMFNEALYNGSRDLFYSFAIITTLLSPSDGIPLSFCEQIYFV